MKYFEILISWHKLCQVVNFFLTPFFLVHHIWSAPVITFPGTQTLHCLDCFGASQRVKTCWENAGYSACAFDLKLNEQHDLSLFGGCVELIRLLFMLLGSIFTGSHVTQWITKNTMQHHGTQWNTCFYYFFKINLSQWFIFYIFYLYFCLIRKVRVFDFMLRTFCVCACPPAVFVCSEAFDWRHRGGWATMQSPHCCQPVCAPEVVGQSHGQYTQHACSIVKPYMDQLCPMVALEEWFIAFRCIQHYVVSFSIITLNTWNLKIEVSYGTGMHKQYQTVFRIHMI